MGLVPVDKPDLGLATLAIADGVDAALGLPTPFPVSSTVSGDGSALTELAVPGGVNSFDSTAGEAGAGSVA